VEVQVAVSKISKYAVSESGDTLEMVERPHGGISFVMVDGQRSGRSAKVISNLVARKAVSLLAEGVRDGSAARAAHDYLYTHRQGKVSATLNITSVDMVSRTMVLCRNNHCPIYIVNRDGLTTLDEPSRAVGVHRNTKPIVTEFPLEAPTLAVIFTDGIISAGSRRGTSLDIPQILQKICLGENCSAKVVADTLFEAAYNLDDKRPVDDISLLVVAILNKSSDSDSRHLELTFPL